MILTNRTGAIKQPREPCHFAKGCKLLLLQITATIIVFQSEGGCKVFLYYIFHPPKSAEDLLGNFDATNPAAAITDVAPKTNRHSETRKIYGCKD